MGKITKLYSDITNIGVTDKLSKLEMKRVRLLNIFISNWFLIELVLITEDYLSRVDPSLQVFIHSGSIIGLLTTLFLQYKRKFLFARILFFSLILYSNFMFCNFAERGGYIEYFYIVVPVFLLLFTNNKYLLYSVFIISYLLFVIPIHLFPIYPEGTFGSPILILIQFIIFFFLVQYFKNANIKSEEILENQRKQLEELNEFQSQFFINVSHEIRTPLTLIKGEVDRLELLKGTTYEKEGFDIKNRLNKQVNKIKTIVDDVLDLAKMKEANFKISPTPYLINKLIDKLYTSFEPLCNQKDIVLTVKKEKDECWVSSDIIFLERALNNIILNAIKYTPKKGNITVSLNKLNGQIIISIKDSGIGISEKDIKLIYNRFYQVKNDINKAGGSGIGLAFSKEIIELHQGSLTVKSELGKGSTFIISLPETTKIDKEIQREKPSKKNTHKSTLISKDKIKQPISGHYRILIVDDNFEMRAYLKRILSNYTCFEAENGEEALDFLSKEKIDFVITDYMMPVMNGLALVENIKKKKINVPILMLTARTDTKSKLEVLRLGIDDYLNKPFEKEELLIRIQNALNNSINRTTFIKENTIEKEELNESNLWIKKVEEFINKQCSDPNMTQEDIAQHFNTSRSSLNRKIKAVTGLTPNQFITEVKLQKARIIIEQNPSILLKTLALEVGYLHTTHFSKIYKQRFGLLPLNKSIIKKEAN
ncbi:signal transduction histidine kinase [Tenacibaculum lutimaris]|uniref:histidine kinase n=1 Tax=Tenacibaculum lutimaris TaxID=285258 RepID=A0A420E0T6_9FLAO|nr:response regulator [Tenacibaculum lutimaris]RKF03724.1 signal transduction histidine kinase [Tenacibaculum lutimaris]